MVVKMAIDIDIIQDVETLLKNLNGYELLSYAICNEECCLLYTSPSPRDRQKSRMPSSA
jgi:hypothetical protein